MWCSKCQSLHPISLNTGSLRYATKENWTRAGKQPMLVGYPLPVTGCQELLQDEEHRITLIQCSIYCWDSIPEYSHWWLPIPLESSLPFQFPGRDCWLWLTQDSLNIGLDLNYLITKDNLFVYTCLFHLHYEMHILFLWGPCDSKAHESSEINSCYNVKEIVTRIVIIVMNSDN